MQVRSSIHTHHEGIWRRLRVSYAHSLLYGVSRHDYLLRIQNGILYDPLALLATLEKAVI